MSIDTQLEILNALRKHLQQLELQHATLGILAPPHISMEIDIYRERINAKEQEIDAEQRQRIQLFFDAHGLNLKPPPLAEGLILLVSPQLPTQPLDQLSTYRAIDYHRATLSHCWLIATEGVRGSKQTAEKLIHHFLHYPSQSGLPIQNKLCLIKNDIDWIEIQQLIQFIYEQIEQHDPDIDPTRVLTDVTGGHKAMTVGAALACGTQRRMQYMYYTKNDNGAIISAPVLLHTITKESI